MSKRLTLVIERRGRPFAELAFDGDPSSARDIRRMREAAVDEISRRGHGRQIEDFSLTVKEDGRWRTTQVALR